MLYKKNHILLDTNICIMPYYGKANEKLYNLKLSIDDKKYNIKTTDNVFLINSFRPILLQKGQI